MASFADFDLLPSLQASLTAQGLVAPTEIQAGILPLLLAGRSAVGVAETGSGKTLAYALPILHLVKTLEAGGSPVDVAARPRAVVLVPTRELGEQVTRVMKSFTHDTRVRIRGVLGGTTMAVARRGLAGPFEILVATPGRLIQLLDREEIALDDVRVLVMDEADVLLDMGFLPAVSRVVEACRPSRQLALFSATVPPAVEALVARLLSDAPIVRTRGHHQVVASLVTVDRAVDDGRRFPVLLDVLREETEGGTILFANTREQCDAVAAQLAEAGHPNVVYRGEMDKVERRANLHRFRDGEVRLLIATDLGSRGLDIEHVGRVINYHLPRTKENYLHRVGRTARAGRTGVVVNFVTPRDQALMARIGPKRKR